MQQTAKAPSNAQIEISWHDKKDLALRSPANSIGLAHATPFQ
jgi:hypothetical protein